jgi:PAS domain S-box-containing protein
MKREIRKQTHDGSISSHPKNLEPIEKPEREGASEEPSPHMNINFQDWDDELDRLLHRNDSASNYEAELERLYSLRAFDRAVLRSKRIEDIEQSVLPLIPKVLFANWIGIAAANFNRSEMCFIAVHPSNVNPGRDWCGPLEGTWTEQIEPPGPVYSIRTLEAIHHTSAFFSTLWEGGIQSLLSIPLITDGRISGFIAFGRDVPYRWTLDDIHLAREIAGSIAVGVQNARQNNRLELKTSIQEYLVSRRAEDFKLSQALYQLIFNNVNFGIALINQAGEIIQANPALLELLGYDIGELLGNTITSFFEPLSFGENEIPTKNNISLSQLQSGSIEISLKHKNGEIISCRLTVSPYHEMDNHKLAIATIEDLDEQKKNQAAIVHAEKLSMTGKLAASLIHEINNPLQSAIGCLDLTEEVMREGGDISKYLHVASEELERAARIVSHLRDLNQPSMHKTRQLRVQDALEHILMLVSKQCRDHGIRVTCHQKDEEISLSLVSERIQQVFLNLALNAIDAMGSGGDLDIYVSKSTAPAGVSVSFIDTGAGISAETLAHIYDPFYSTKTGGLGLGLYISKSIVLDLGGKIEVKSYPGNGTTFTVWCPTEISPPGKTAENKEMSYE